MEHEALDVKRDRFPNQAKIRFRRVRRNPDAWNIGRISAAASRCLLDCDGVFHGRSPACLSMLRPVPIARSCFGLPASVTTPVLLGRTNRRWLPRVRARRLVFVGVGPRTDFFVGGRRDGRESEGN